MSLLNADVNAWNDLRPEVQQMALAMESQLRANDHKDGWQNDSVDSLIERIYEETAEVVEAVAEGDAVRVLAETADVCNFNAFVADKFGGLTPLNKLPSEGGHSDGADALTFR